MDSNLAAIHEAIATQHPERPCIIQGERRSSSREVDSRARRLAAALGGRGTGLDHPSVLDVVVVGRPSGRWGSEILAVAEVADGTDDAELLDTASQHPARHELPKAIIRRDQLQRSPADKADHRWATQVAASDASGPGRRPGPTETGGAE